jgi:Ankyrin repeats (3 copies)
MQAERLGTSRIFGSVILVLLAAGASPAQASPQAPAASGATTTQAGTTSEKADAFLEAARKGDAAGVRKLLDEGVDVNTRFRYDRTALSYACDRGHVEVVKLLLDRGADVNVEDTFYHATALSWAVNPAMGRTPQHPEIVALLLTKNPKGKESALMAAVAVGDVAMSKMILDAGPLPAGALSDALASATRGNKKEIVALLEQAGAKPRPEFKIDPAQLAKYAGTFSGPGGAELVLTASGASLTGAINAQRLTFVARDATTFGVAEAPGVTLTLHIEGDKVTAVGFPNDATRWTRVEGK